MVVALSLWPFEFQWLKDTLIEEHGDWSSQYVVRCLKNYVVSKQHRKEFPYRKSWRAKKVLKLVHFDLCGPINPSWNWGKRYFITFIDDCSRKTWVYFLQDKSEAFNAFKNFKTHVDNEVERTIKILCTDRGVEFCSKEFQDFCDEYGIQRHLTTSYTPQQNGISKRKNQTILNMVRCMLTNMSVLKNFWPKVLKWSIRVLNRSPTFVVQNMTPEEAWNGWKSSVDHFKVFGCIAYAHVLDEKRKKLDDKGVKYVFLGISCHDLNPGSMTDT